MGVSAGSYTVGAGGTYPDFASALNDSLDLTGNLTFTQISDVTESPHVTWARNTNGFTMRLTSNKNHLGQPSLAWKWNLSQAVAGRMFDFVSPAGANGLVQIDGLYPVIVAPITTTFWLIFGLAVPAFGASTTQSYRLFNCLFDLGNKSNGGALLSPANGGAAPVLVWNCKLWNSGGASGLAVQKDQDKIENCTFYSTVAATGFSGDRFSILQNNASYAPGGNAFAWPSTFGSHATSHGNASSDNTSQGAGTQSGNFINRTTAADLVSTNPASANFLKPKTSGVLKAGGVAPLIAQNVQGINGIARPTGAGIISIGADQWVDPNTPGIVMPAFVGGV